MLPGLLLIGALCTFAIFFAPSTTGAVCYFVANYLLGRVIYRKFSAIWPDAHPIDILFFSSIFGFMCLPLVMLFWGHLGLRIDLSTVLLCDLLVLIALRDTTRNSPGASPGAARMCFFLFPVGIIFAFLFLVDLSVFFAPWDHFSFWLLDAKLIFRGQKLVDNGDVQDFFVRSSYYPIQAAMLYFFSGRVVEQFSGLITTIYGLFGAYLCLRFSQGKSWVVGLLALAVLTCVLTSFVDNQALIFTYYVDLTTAFYALFFTFVLLSPVSQASQMALRVSLLSIILGVLFLLKEEHYIYVFLLGAIWVCYDLYANKAIVRETFSEKRSRTSILGYVCLALVFWLAKFYYHTRVHLIPNGPYDLSESRTRVVLTLLMGDLGSIWPIFALQAACVAQRMARRAFFSRPFVAWGVKIIFFGVLLTFLWFAAPSYSAYQLDKAYASQVFSALYTTHWYIGLVFACLLVSEVMALLWTRRLSLRSLLLTIIILVIASGPVIHYLLSRPSLVSQSLLRYVSVPFFVLVLLAVEVGQRSYRSRVVGPVFCLSLLGFCFWRFLAVDAPRLIKHYAPSVATIGRGEYSEFRWQQAYHAQAQGVKKRIRGGRLVVCQLLTEDGRCSNSDMPGIIHRYHLAEVAKGGQVFGENLFKLIHRTKAKFVFLPVLPSFTGKLLDVPGEIDTQLFSIRRDSKTGKYHFKKIYA